MKHTLKSLLLCMSTFSALADTTLFPKHQITLDYYNHQTFPMNFPTLPKPLFWHSRYRVQSGGRISYAYTRFHTSKHFSVNLGLSLAGWQSDNQDLWVFSGFFELRWWLFRTATFNPYLFYSLAGPSLMTRDYFAGSKLGSYFTFQDYLGAGVMLGKNHHLTIEAKVIHYSNGDLAQYNKGLQVPFVIAVGYLF